MAHPQLKVLERSTQFESIYDALAELQELTTGKERAAYETCEDRLAELEGYAEEVKDRQLSMDVDEVLDELEDLAIFFEVHQMRIHLRAEMLIRQIKQDPHFRQVEMQRNETLEEQVLHDLEREANRTCHACKAPMQIRQNSNDGSFFWGCCNFISKQCRVSYNLTKQEEAFIQEHI